MNVRSPAHHRARHWFLVFVGLSLFQRSASAQPLAWVEGDGCRVAELRVPTAGRTGFTLLRPGETGIRFTNALSYDRSEANQNLLNGAGVAAGDFDGDGLCDLYFANPDGPNALYRNLGQGRFEDATRLAGVECTNQFTKGVAFADLDGDGRLDLLAVSLGGPNAAFQNLGGGRFTNITAAAGLLLRSGSHSLALADIDGDGDLDLYIANYGVQSILRSGGQISVRKVNGRDTIAGRFAKRLKLVNGQIIELGEPHTLYLNDGKGNFAPVSWTDGRFRTADGHPLASEPYDLGLSVMFRDINGDGFPDIYVCNDFETPDRIWINDGQGRFRALPDLAVRATPHFSMGVDFADIDRDGLDDFFAGDMLSPRHRLRMTQKIATNPPPSQVGEISDRQQIRQNVLSWNRGDGTYANIADFAGVDATDWTWSVVFLDVDLDGFEDLLVANGHGYDTQDHDMHERQSSKIGIGLNQQIGKQLREFPPLITPNYAYRNRGNRTFEEVGVSWGFHSTNVSHGIALADLDNDGDLDVVVNGLWQPPLVYRNDSTAPRLAVRLRGLPPNTRGVGAKIKVMGGAVPVQTQEMQCGGRYLSADEPIRAFAAGSLTNTLTLEITWRSGRRSVIKNAKPNHLYEVAETGARPASPVPPPPPSPRPAFQEVSSLLNHLSASPAFDDLERQPLLYKSFASLGPGVAWADLDGDGHDELIIAGSRNSPPAIFSNDGKMAFKRWNSPALSQALNRDQSGLVAWTSASGQVGLLAGQSSYREAAGTASGLAQLTVQGVGPAASASWTTIPGVTLPQSSAGPIVVADLDGDGDLDLFIGGRVVPGRYPEKASSVLYRNEGGTLKRDEINAALLHEVGLVSGAVFSDLNADGWPELILACEWGPVKIFRNDKGKLSPWDIPLSFAPGGPGASPAGSSPATPATLGKLDGWWNGVATGDLDGDGRLDLIASNWGLNSASHDPSLHPVRLYHGDFDGNGTVDLLEAETDPEDGRVVARRDLAWLSVGWPALRARFPSHRAFSGADVTALIGTAAQPPGEVQAHALASMAFLNRGDHFEARRLPDEAQWTSAFGINIADFDGDGAEDIFLSQNFFALRPEEIRLDAGRGLWLRGDGAGHLRAVPGQESGVVVYGEQRGSALGDFDEDGRVDLVVAQNGAATRLFHNETARPGLRVRLRGPKGNPQGLGATLRLRAGQKNGPAREVQGGSGYWSQNSVVTVLATAIPAATASITLSVRWPGGQTSTHEVPADAKEIAVSLDGNTRKIR